MSSINDLGELSSARDIAEFKQRMSRLVHDLEFGLFQAALVTAVPGREVSISECSNNHPEWNTLDHQKDLERDPLVRRFKTMSVPFMYDADLYGSEGAYDLWEKQAPFGYRTGVVVAMHLTGFRHFVLGIDREKALPKEERQLARLFADVQLLAVHAEVAGRRLLAPTDGAGASMLTPRELEVLRLASNGKSAWIAGQLLSISERTVKAHLERIYEKLGVTSKTQAILKAHETGLI